MRYTTFLSLCFVSPLDWPLEFVVISDHKTKYHFLLEFKSTVLIKSNENEISRKLFHTSCEISAKFRMIETMFRFPEISNQRKVVRAKFRLTELRRDAKFRVKNAVALALADLNKPRGTESVSWYGSPVFPYSLASLTEILWSLFEGRGGKVLTSRRTRSLAHLLFEFILYSWNLEKCCREKAKKYGTAT